MPMFEQRQEESKPGIDIPVGLHYVDDTRPGISRKLQRGKFAYFDTAGRRIKDPKEVKRINALAIPPAYQKVWICPDPAGHIQATARDARGRKQYRYNPLWCSVRDADKFGRLLQFGQALPAIRKRVERDLQRKDFGRERLIAAVVRLLDLTLIRVGNQKYAKANRSYGLTTLRTRHTEVLGNAIRFRFRGKSGIDHDVRISDGRLARIVRRCLEIPGQELFQYLDAEGGRHPIGSADVNAYLKTIVEQDFTAKDYRTWAGSVHAFDLLQKSADELDRRPKVVVEVIKSVSRRLANTPAICRKCYVHPIVVEHFLEGQLPAFAPVAAPRMLRADERRFLKFLADRPAPSS
jgi:DNA topoisomerase I